MNLNDQLNELYNLYIAAKEVRHGIKKSNDWAFFEPTKFVYAFFTFNSLYSINWQETVSEHNIILLDTEMNIETGKSEPISESRKMNKMVNFIVDSLDNEDVPLRLSMH